MSLGVKQIHLPMQKIYDALIIGGGFAGLSAAIYLSRFNRSVLVIDRGDGRWKTHEYNENYLGFPDGIVASSLRNLGVKQAQRFGATIITDEVLTTEKRAKTFVCTTASMTKYTCRTIILATGVVDDFPHFDKWREYVGRSLFWCITCDGYKTRNKKIVVVGADDEAVCSAFQFLAYTQEITVVTNQKPGNHTISQHWLDLLHTHGLKFYEGIIKQVTGKDGYFEAITLDTGVCLPLTYLISQQGSIPNTHLALTLGIALDKNGFILADIEQRTNIPYIYTAGDVTKAFAHQIVTAVHEGSAAAQAANYDLYLPYQKIS
jgi:thioredoxin reductase (NADPH)